MDSIVTVQMISSIKLLAHVQMRHHNIFAEASRRAQARETSSAWRSAARWDCRRAL